MTVGPQAHLLEPGGRLHLHHGPIDLVSGVEGPAREACLTRAARRFETLLEDLVAELPVLRRSVSSASRVKDPVARRMIAAVRPHAGIFVTPMAAVAGAVADEILAAMNPSRDVNKAYVNNGGDVAFHLAPGAQFTSLSPAGEMTLAAEGRARGVATSGWRGRSHSLGIADAVTVAAPTAAAADVAATLIANAVDLPGHPGIERLPAEELAPDSDLGATPVTVGVALLGPSEIATALSAGLDLARQMTARGLIDGAALVLQGERAVTGLPAPQQKVLSDA
jgi:ApbE superfamily uncharacterized protein (UPF0280 family)